MEKIKVWNWQRIHGENASCQGWVYQMLMDKRITCLPDQSVQLTAEPNTIARIGDYLVWFDDTDELRTVEKEDFETNYVRMT